MACRLALFLLVRLALAGAAVTISARTLRLQPGVTFELAAHGRSGCFDWTSGRDDIAEIISTRCDGDSSFATVITKLGDAATDDTHEETSRVMTFVTARPLEGPADSVFCEVTVSRIARMQILNTVHDMVAHEMQWLSLNAEDDEGNDFSTAGLDALDVEWRFEPSGLVSLLAPSETRQQLDPALEAAEAGGRWSRFHRVAVRAGSEPAAKLTVVAYTRFSAGAHTRVASEPEALSIEPSADTLSPSRRAVLAPSFSLRYELRKCSRKGRCSATPPSELREWAVLPSRVAHVSADGTLTATGAGEATLHVTQPLVEGSASLLVTPPARVQLDVLDGRDLGPADASWSGAPTDPLTLLHQASSSPRLQSSRLVRVRVISRDGGGLSHVLPPAGKGHPAHLMPTLAVSMRVAPNSALGTAGEPLQEPPPVALRRVEAWQCGEECTLEGCGRTGGAPCASGLMPHALCRCEMLIESAPAAITLTATLAASPINVEEEVSWPELRTDLDVNVVAPLVLSPAQRTVAWVCPAGATDGGVPVLPLPAVSGGSGVVTWHLQGGLPEAAALIAPASTIRVLRPATSREMQHRSASIHLTATDAIPSLPPVEATIDVRRIAALRVASPAREVAAGETLNLSVSLLDEVSRLRRDSKSCRAERGAMLGRALCLPLGRPRPVPATDSPRPRIPRLSGRHAVVAARRRMRWCRPGVAAGIGRCVRGVHSGRWRRCHHRRGLVRAPMCRRPLVRDDPAAGCGGRGEHPSRELLIRL